MEEPNPTSEERALRTIYHVSCSIGGNRDFFFNARGKLLVYGGQIQGDVSCMDALLYHLGFKIESLSWSHPKVKPTIKKLLLDIGAAVEDDFGIIGAVS